MLDKIRKKCLFCDLDGTLIKDGFIASSVVKKIQNFVKLGNLFIIATGRSDFDIKHILETNLKFQSPYRVSENGNVIKNSLDEVVFLQKIPQLELQKIKDFLFFNTTVRLEVADGDFRYSEKNRPHEIPMEYVDKFKIVNNLYDKIGEEILPISFLLHEENEEYLFNLRDEINLNFVNLQAVITFKGTLEVFSNLASKGSAIQTICEIENITNMEDVFAVGDAGNDIAMFKVLGKNNSFSMNSALNYVKDYTNISVNNVGDVVDILLQ